MKGWRQGLKSHLECYTHVVTSKPCQSAQTRELVSVRNARGNDSSRQSAQFGHKAKLFYAKERYNCRQYCFGLLGLISAVPMKGWRQGLKSHLECYTHVVTSKPIYIYISNRDIRTSDMYLRNGKHFPCFYRFIETRVEVWENEKCCGNTSRRRVFPQLFREMFSISFRK